MNPSPKLVFLFSFWNTFFLVCRSSPLSRESLPWLLSPPLLPFRPSFLCFGEPNFPRNPFPASSCAVLLCELLLGRSTAATWSSAVFERRKGRKQRKSGRAHNEVQQGEVSISQSCLFSFLWKKAVFMAKILDSSHCSHGYHSCVGDWNVDCRNRNRVKTTKHTNFPTHCHLLWFALLSFTAILDTCASFRHELLCVCCSVDKLWVESGGRLSSEIEYVEDNVPEEYRKCRHVTLTQKHEQTSKASATFHVVLFDGLHDMTASQLLPVTPVLTSLVVHGL